MKTPATYTTPRLVSRIALGAAFLLVLQAAPPLHAADVTWSSTGTFTPGGDGNWTGGTTWWNGSSAVAWNDGDNAFFTALGNTTVDSAVAVNQITFSNSAANISVLGGAGDLSLASGITAVNTANTIALTYTISESIALGANQTWTVSNGGAIGTANLLVSGNISGTGLGITKAGNGTLTLSGTNNTYTGTTTVNAGTLILANTAANNKTIGGNILINGGTLNLGAANQIADTASVTVTSGTFDTWQNETISSLLVNGGTLNLRSSTLTSSAFSLTSGAINVGVRATAFTFNGPVTLGNFNANWIASSASADGVVFGGNITVNDNTTANFIGSGGRITLKQNRTIDVGTGANMNVAWGIVGTGFGITKEGAGTLTLSNANTYSGATVVSAGSMIVNGSTAAGSALTVDSGATLGGSGTIGGATIISGILAPGNSIGTLTVANDVTWNAGDNWVFELGTAGPSIGTPGTSDLLAITGGNDFLRGTGPGWTFDFAGTATETGWYKLVDWTGGTTTFDVADFAGVNLGGTYTSEFAIQDSALYVNVVPEPSTWALLALGVGVVALKIRRRCRRA